MHRHHPGRATGRPSRWTGRAGKLAQRPVCVLSAFGLVIVAGAVAVGVLPRLPAPVARADDVTASQNNLRTGWDPSEPHLAPVNDGGPVGGPGFGQLFETHLDGQVIAQPIVVGDTLIAATETNHVYGLNAVTGAVEWSDSLGKPEPWSATGCYNVYPYVGITSAPVYDPATGTIYLVALIDDGPSVIRPHIYAYALNPATGHILPGWPVAISGSPVNAPQDTFNPLTERQRAGLLLLNGSIYMSFGSYCDYKPYAGYVAGVNASTRHVTLWTDEAGLTEDQGGIWQSGGGMMSDGSGRIFVATGNGISPPVGPGKNPPSELGDAVVRLAVAANGTLSAGDFFSPSDAPTLDAFDEDFGSGGPVGLPFGTASYPDLLVQAGKDGRIFLMNRDNLGGRSQGPGSSDADVSVTGPFGGVWGHPAAFGPDATVAAPTSGDYVYYVGSGDVMRYLQFGEDSSGTPTLTDVANSTTTFAYRSGSPTVSSNGNDPASAVVWEIAANGRGSSLDAFGAVPPSGCAAPCQMAPIWSGPIGTASEFSIPVTDNGRVYVGTLDGNVLGFGSPDAAPLTAAAVNFGKVALGKSRTMTVTLTAAGPVTVTGLSAGQPAGGSPFAVKSPTVGGKPATFPVTLGTGGMLTVRASFAPSEPGGVTGALQVATNAANFPAVNISVTGQGTTPGLQPSARQVSFRAIPEGLDPAKVVTVTNDSTSTERIRATTAPGAPFTVTLPRVGSVIRPGGSVAVSVAYRSASAALRRSSFQIRTSDGRRLTVKVKGSGIPAVSRFTAQGGAVSFGSVHLGTRAPRTITITNRGNLPLTLTGVSRLTAPFGVQAAVPAGLPVSPRYKVTIPVTFTPTSSGAVSTDYLVHWRDAAGAHTLVIPLSGTGDPAASGRRAIVPPGGGWTFSGSAAMSGRALRLTGARARQAGAAVYAAPERASGLAASYTTSLGGDGSITLSLLNASTSRPAALGGSGPGGTSGVAVTLATGKLASQLGGSHASSFAGIAVTTPAGHRWVARTTRLPALASGPHRIRIAVRGRKVIVDISGRQVLAAHVRAPDMPRQVFIEFSGSTGPARAVQSLSSVTIKARGQAVPPPGGGWSFNGSALMSGSAAELTKAAPKEAGSAVYPVAVPTSGLRVTFTAMLSGGTGSDGMAFAMLDPATSTATSLGGDGKANGFGGLGGLAIGLDTDPVPNQGRNGVYIASGTVGSAMTVLDRAAALPPLRPGPDTVTFQIEPVGTESLVTVWLDGEQVLELEVGSVLPTTALLAFTGGTSAKTNAHIARDVAISAAG
jgi:hypothetical protein